MFFFNQSPDVRKLEQKADITGLIKALRHGERPIRLSAARALGRLADRQAIAPLSAILTDKSYIQVYFASAHLIRDAICEITGTGNLEQIIDIIDGIETFNSGKYAIRSLVGFAIGAEENLLVSTLIQREWNIMREAAATSLGQISGPTQAGVLIKAFDELASTFDASSGEHFRKNDLAIALPIIKACNDSAVKVRQAIIKALVNIGEPAAVELLLPILNQPDNPVFDTAVEALGKFGDLRAVLPLIALLQAPDFQLREIAAKALGDLGDASASRPLVEALRDPELHVCEAAASSLRRIGKPAIDHLIAALEDADMHVRKLAAQILGEIGDVLAATHLKTALTDSKHNVRLAAAEALLKLKSAAPIS